MKIVSQEAYGKIAQIKGYQIRCQGHSLQNGKMYELWTFLENKTIGCKKRIGSKRSLYNLYSKEG